MKEQEKERIALYRKLLPDEEKEKVKEEDKNSKVLSREGKKDEKWMTGYTRCVEQE